MSKSMPLDLVLKKCLFGPEKQVYKLCTIPFLEVSFQDYSKANVEHENIFRFGQPNQRCYVLGKSKF